MVTPANTPTDPLRGLAPDGIVDVGLLRVGALPLRACPGSTLCPRLPGLSGHQPPEAQ